MVRTQAAQAHNARSYCFFFFFFTFFANTQRNVTCGIYYYTTIEFDFAKRDSRLAAYGGVVLQRLEFIRFVWERNGFAGKVNSA